MTELLYSVTKFAPILDGTWVGGMRQLSYDLFFKVHFDFFRERLCFNRETTTLLTKLDFNNHFLFQSELKKIGYAHFSTNCFICKVSSTTVG